MFRFLSIAGALFLAGFTPAAALNLGNPAALSDFGLGAGTGQGATTGTVPGPDLTVSTRLILEGGFTAGIGTDPAGAVGPGFGATLPLPGLPSVSAGPSGVLSAGDPDLPVAGRD